MPRTAFPQNGIILAARAGATPESYVSKQSSSISQEIAPPWDASAAPFPSLTASAADDRDPDAGFGASTMKLSEITVYTHQLAPTGVEWDPIPQLIHVFFQLSAEVAAIIKRLYAF